MEELIEKINNLKNILDNTEEVKKISLLNEQIKNNQELLSKIKLYNETKKESLKEEIYADEIYQKYKETETDLNILILEINKKLKKISNKGKCNI